MPKNGRWFGPWPEYQRTPDFLKMHAMHEAGATLDECGRAFGVSAYRVRQVLYKHSLLLCREVACVARPNTL